MKLIASGVGFIFNNLVMPKPVLNLGAPLDYLLIMGAGLFTLIYIVARALGKYFGASITKSPTTVKKYLGFTFLPHSGVSLVFTGIAVSALSVPAPECAGIPFYGHELGEGVNHDLSLNDKAFCTSLPFRILAKQKIMISV